MHLNTVSACKASSSRCQLHWTPRVNCSLLLSSPTGAFSLLTSNLSAFSLPRGSPRAVAEPDHSAAAAKM